ncbi:Transcriptional regulator containing PAS, AAA-type ATPase, and DNA-binding Fis domains [Acetoanaerobium noterae]|uniref:Transcriptional regulator containing PAS, AAA-type ATPase, and DNA-binding Fis domains n=1 Tax=Acetoanaerobium noterae TaxID=745369 RepID=A0A1T5C635_9FIRM|nr:sigma 54-interacting transcriptional regulator [Acetoanaerobium noterae]SKB54590.1 Transcriptional regulator containing PAS, AAA-type ATPase, and DNA-binding Fis domains [Acetoanaerobium noterae]
MDNENNIFLKENKDNLDYKEILNVILNNAYEWLVIIDDKGYIMMMSKGYKEFIGDMVPEGKHVTEVIENTKLHDIVKTGKTQIGEIQIIKGQQVIASRLPIIKDNKIIGAIGKVIFKDITDFYDMSKKIITMEKEIKYYKDQLKKQKSAKYSFSNIIGESKSLMEVKNICQRAAMSDSNVLIMGESGTGKELFAHAIHNASDRASGPFVKINCAAIPSELLESELFGYEGGAFTGAKKEGKVGKFELANGGSIFLDEIGDMPLQMQVKLLRVLQEREIERIGSTKTRPINVRIISATNKNLEEEVKSANFREDLYYRLNVMSVNIEPLRKRKDDIRPLAKALVKKLSSQMGVHVDSISEKAMAALEAYDWPGNIRELENVIERSINLLDSDRIIKVSTLPVHITQSHKTHVYIAGSTLKEQLYDVEKSIILECLNENQGNKQKTANDLDMSRTSLYQKLKSYGID